MGKAKKKPTEAEQRCTYAIAWFATLAHAKLRNKFSEAAEAQDALDQLGVRVRFARATKRS